jgi:hypothetical protein
MEEKMKRVILAVIAIGFLAVSCSGKKETGSASGGENVKATSNDGSSVTVKAGTPAPASDFIVELREIGGNSVVFINDYTGNAKILTFPATIEDIPVHRITIGSINSNVEQVFVPEGVKEAGFRNFPNLRAVSLPDTLERIFSFRDCINLKSITIPSSVTHIGREAFKGTGLQSIVIPASAESNGNDVFENCKSLTSVEIYGNDVRFRFEGCDNLKNVILGEGIKVVLEDSFRGLKNLETVKLPDSLVAIFENAFRDCHSLKTIVLPKGLTSISNYAFSGSGLTEVTFQKTDELLTIYGAAFKGCKELVTVNFEEGVEKDVTIDFREVEHFSDCPKLSLRSQAAIKALGGYL